MLMDCDRGAVRRRRRDRASSVWSRATGRSGPTAASSTRSRCSRSSAGRRNRSGCRPPARVFRISCGWRVIASRCRRSRWRTMRSCLPSSLLDEVSSSGLRLESMAPARVVRVFAHEALMRESSRRLPSPIGPAVAASCGRRRSCEDARFTGSAGCAQPTAYAVSHVERYLECPFKYFAAHVLKLPEERDEQAWMTPQERGQFVHEVFEGFFVEWQRRGGGAVTTANVARGDGVCSRRSRRAGSAALPKGIARWSARCCSDPPRRPGLASARSRSRSSTDAAVVERLLEYELRGHV